MPHRPPREGRLERWLPRHPAHIGRRGAILLSFGVIWMITGFSVFYDFGSSVEPSALLHARIPNDIRAWAWIGTGSLAVFHAFRPPGMSDALGFGSLYIMPTIRLVSYFLAWMDSWPMLDPWLGGVGDPTAWRGAAIYAAMVASVMICAGWPEPLDPDALISDSEDEQ